MPPLWSLVIQKEINEIVGPFRLIKDNEGANKPVFIRGVIYPFTGTISTRFKELIIPFKSVVNLWFR